MYKSKVNRVQSINVHVHGHLPSDNSYKRDFIYRTLNTVLLFYAFNRRCSLIGSESIFLSGVLAWWMKHCFIETRNNFYRVRFQGSLLIHEMFLYCLRLGHNMMLEMSFIGKSFCIYFVLHTVQGDRFFFNIKVFSLFFLWLFNMKSTLDLNFKIVLLTFELWWPFRKNFNLNVLSSGFKLRELMWLFYFKNFF